MGYDNTVLRRATAKLEARRTRRSEELERRRTEVYARCPRAAEIDRELRRTIVDIISASLKNGSDPVPSIQVIRDHNLDLQQERAAVLEQAGYSPDVLDD